MDVTAAPDGSLFIADWYDPGVGGHQVIDLNRGRIYRVTKNESGYKILNPRLKIPRFQMMPRKGVHRTHIRIACNFSLRTDQCIFVVEEIKRNSESHGRYACKIDYNLSFGRRFNTFR